jgi:hypothetical protein
VGVSFDLLTLFGLEDFGCGGANTASASDNGSGSFSRGMLTWSMRARRRAKLVSLTKANLYGALYMAAQSVKEHPM